ncbi:RNA polymerase sigma factor (sigma-70 family) [Kribbella sp. VKM Ac-2527]|uniref:RNA polymerase sigma factor (Sigma-70 family) n=1 Tax=Kribbella caucasensis TaxID=2512215 RepID=A0A4R6IXY9_9ACTN|nr:bifunctional nuclease domain-containing protein [Kribbella sp. VKM Ac-2527]TDO27660.1 RNA polymerase sigma factor (sigma-70 family) [Kribbella sp. VKM Ac-2527]
MTAGPADAVLVAAARKGDKTAFAELVDRHYPLLLTMCRRAVIDPHMAGDAAQEAVLDAMLGIDRLRDPDRFGPWLAGIGLNVCRRMLHRRIRAGWSLDAMLDAGWTAEPVDPGAGPDELTVAAHLVAVVRTAVRALPPGQQAAATLYYLDGLTCGEVAEHLGTSVGAVKARLHKARATLRRQLAPGWKEPAIMSTTDQLPMSMRIRDVRATEQAAERRHVVVLTTDDGTQNLMIWIGSAEALALARTLEGVQLPRPSVYHLTAALLQAAGRRLAETRITALTDQVIYAQTVLDDGAVVDARPSDALNLALLADAPIHVDPAVLQADQRADDHEDPTDYPMDARAILNAAT